MKKVLLSMAAFLLTVPVWAQEETPKEEGYIFTDKVVVPTTSVKNQSRTSTCWSFAGAAWLESELLRMGKPETDLSEMWIVRNSYIDKAVRFARMHGNASFAPGGALMDIIDVMSVHGLVPEDAYPGMNYGADLHNHSELDAVVSAYMNAVIKQKRLSTAWLAGLNGILDAYLGKAPEKFVHNGKEYTPQTYAASLGLDPADYISVTSFTHHPFYTRFAIEIPDNWTYSLSYNVPLDELTRVIESAVENGYTVGWGADVSEKGFAYNKGVAVILEADVESMDGTEQARWVALTEREKEAALYKFDKPGKEKTITQQLRQKGFDNYDTTDDHGMQIMGIATDQNGTKYFKVKNSWGTSQLYEGYFYASYPYVAYKTINITVHKDAVPSDIARKMGL